MTTTALVNSFKMFGGSGPPPVDTLVVAGAGNTAQLLTPVTSTPHGSGISRTPSASVASIQTAINASGPGDVILVPTGSYNGNLNFTTSGDSANPIVLRPAAGATVVWTGGQWSFTGSYVSIGAGIRVTSTVNDFASISGSSRNIRISTVNFDHAGSGAGADSIGLIKIHGNNTWETTPNNAVADLIPKVQIVRNVTVDSCVFNQPKNAPLWVNHGSQGILITHCTVNGPHGITSGETEMFKFGWGRGFDEVSNSTIQFCTFSDTLVCSPYVIGLKMSYITMKANIIQKGRIEIRAADHCQLLGNVSPAGNLHVAGANHSIKHNFIRTVDASADGFGPIMLQSDNGNSPYNSSGNWFYRAAVSCLIEDNTFHNDDTSIGFAVIMSYTYYATHGATANANTFKNNAVIGTNTSSPVGAKNMIRQDGTDANTAAFIAANTWSGNVFTANPAPTGMPSGNSTSTTGLHPSVPTLVNVTA